MGFRVHWWDFKIIFYMARRRGIISVVSFIEATCCKELERNVLLIIGPEYV
jgi:hypothetical protein